MTRYDLATVIMKRLPHVSRRRAMDIVDCALEEIAEALLERGECVKLHELEHSACAREPRAQLALLCQEKAPRILAAARLFVSKPRFA